MCLSMGIYKKNRLIVHIRWVKFLSGRFAGDEMKSIRLLKLSGLLPNGFSGMGNLICSSVNRYFFVLLTGNIPL